ncbi:Sensor histidine kinase RcsC [subsurface metagenome]
MLRKLNAKIFWAQNGINAIDLCTENQFDLIFMDIKMPAMDGYEATSRLRKKGNSTPIIAQTAYARIEDEKIILQKGFDGYLPKPIDRKKLLSLIDKYYYSFDFLFNTIIIMISLYSIKACQLLTWTSGVL